MKTISKDELYRHLCGFLTSKGVELKEGPYAQCVRQGCALLTDVVNTARSTVRRAKAKADQKLDELRRTIHEATAPSPSPAKPGRAPRGPAPGTGRRKKPAPRAKARHRK